jgi:hypothetical protein
MTPTPASPAVCAITVMIARTRAVAAIRARLGFFQNGDRHHLQQ